MRSFLFCGLLLLSVGCRDIVDGLSEDEPETCDLSTDCGGDEVCIGGHCGLAGSVGQGGHCWASRDCKEGLFCSPISSECFAEGTGVEGEVCKGDEDCVGGLRCELGGFQGTCSVAGTGEPGTTCTTNSECLAGLYCEDGTCKSFFEAYPPFGGVTCTPAEGPFRLYFEVPRPGAPPADFYRLPFPNDVRVSAAGALDMSDFPRPGPTPLGIDLAQLYVDALVSDFTGFGSTASILFRFAGEPDFDSIDGQVKFVDVTPGPSFGVERGLGWSSTTGRTKYNCENRLAVRNNPYEPLEPGHTYAVYLTGEIAAPNGTKAVQDDDFVTVLAAQAPTDADLQRAWDAYAPFRAFLTAKSIQPGSIAGAAVFTVQDTTGVMGRLASNLATQPVPELKDVTLCDTGVTSPCDDGSGERACPAANADFYEVHGRLSVPIYQAGTAPYLHEGGGIVETGGIPQVQRTEDVCFALTIPKSAAPVTGWPLMVYGHGTGGSMRSFVGAVGTTMATATVPAAVIGIDMIHHGARRGDSTEDPDNLVFNVLNPRAARDNLIQGAVDLLQTMRVAGLPAFEVVGVGPVVFDTAKVMYFGHSQGSQSGILAAAVSSAPGAVVFSGAGAFLTSTLLNKTKPVNIAVGMQFLFSDSLEGNHPVMQLFQTYFERSDAANYGPLVVRKPPAGVTAKHAFMTFGKDDSYTPRDSQRNNVKALGLQVAQPFVIDEDFDVGTVSRPASINVNVNGGGKRTGVCVQYEPGDYDGHFVSTRNPAAVTDWSAFLASWLTTGTPVVP